VHELGVVLPRDRSDLGTAPFPGIDVRDVLRRALRAHADPTVTDAEIERVLPAPALIPRPIASTQAR
jgi:hypothetical protein